MTRALSNTKLVIATHIYATGPALDLLDYLNGRAACRLLFISHPLFYSSHLKGSGYQLFSSGKLLSESFAKLRKISDLLTYFIHPLLTLWYVLKTGSKWDVFIGSDNLNAICGVILKKIGVVNKTIYYVIDYNPHRFSNKYLNATYHFLDQVCVKYSDETWNLSSRMAPARKKYFDFSGGHQRVVPIGIWYDRIHTQLKIDDYHPFTLVYMGQVAKKQGIQHVLNAIPLIIEKIPQFKFQVLGGGDYLDELQAATLRLGLKNYVEFTGFIADHQEIETRLSHCAVAVALYDKYVDGELSFTYFTDPGKVKVYLAAGLPILISNVPYNASEIERKKCGFVVENNPISISKAVIKLMSNSKNLLQYKANAREYAKNFNWEIIFDKALTGIL